MINTKTSSSSMKHIYRDVSLTPSPVQLTASCSRLLLVRPLCRAPRNTVMSFPKQRLLFATRVHTVSQFTWFQTVRTFCIIPDLLKDRTPTRHISRHRRSTVAWRGDPRCDNPAYRRHAPAALYEDIDRLLVSGRFNYIRPETTPPPPRAAFLFLSFIQRPSPADRHEVPFRASPRAIRSVNGLPRVCVTLSCGCFNALTTTGETGWLSTNENRHDTVLPTGRWFRGPNPLSMHWVLPAQNQNLLLTSGHRLRIRILRILKVLKIQEFLRILKLLVLKFIKFNLSHSSPPSSNKLFVANKTLNFWTKKSVMSTIQDSLTRQQFGMILSSLTKSTNPCSFTVLYLFVIHQCR